MAPASLSSGFQSFTLLPTIKLGPSSAGSRVGGPVHAPGPCGSLQSPLLRGWESLLLPPQPPRVFSIRGLRHYFPRTGTLGYAVCFAPPPFILVYLCANVGPQGLLEVTLPSPFVPQSATSLGPRVLSAPGCPSPPLLQVWMNVYFLSPWCRTSLLLDFL